MAFAPSWGGKYSKYDPNAPVNPKRAKEIFPQDFINIFLRIVGEATTAKVARLTIKELAKKNGGKAGNLRNENCDGTFRSVPLFPHNFHCQVVLVLVRRKDVSPES